MAVIGIAGWISAGTGLLGAMSSGGKDGGGGGQQVNTKEPWAEAAPWLKKQIKDGMDLQQNYLDNPFNSQQKTAYQNTFDDLNNYRSNIAPGIMNFANQAMTGGGFQRQRYERPGEAGYAPRQPQQPQQPQQPAGLMGTPNGPFGVSGAGLMNEGSRYAPVDFGTQKPVQQMAPQPSQPEETEEQRLMREVERLGYQRPGDYR